MEIEFNKPLVVSLCLLAALVIGGCAIAVIVLYCKWEEKKRLQHKPSNVFVMKTLAHTAFVFEEEETVDPEELGDFVREYYKSILRIEEKKGR